MQFKEWLCRLIIRILSLQGNPSVLPWALDQIGRLFEGEPERFLRFLKQFHTSEPWLERFFVAHQVGRIHAHNPEETLRLLDKLSNDDNDLVLEGAAHSWSTALEQNFDEVFDRIKRLADGENYAQRRTAALAPVEYYRDGPVTPDEREQIETFWEQFESDDKKGLRNLVRQQIKDRIVNSGD